MYAIETFDLCKSYVRYRYPAGAVSFDSSDNPGGVFLSLYRRLLGKGVVKEEVVALDHVNIRVGEGRVVGLLGPNGSGKTTLLRVLCGIYRPTSGTASIMGRDILKYENELWRYVTYVAGLLSGGMWMDARLTAREVLDVQCRVFGLPRERVGEALRLSGLEDVADVRVATFSTGMLARLSFCTGLLKDCPVYLMDEPMAGISKETADELYSHIRFLCDQAGATILYATNNVYEAERLCDEVIIMVRGRAVTQSSIEDLMREVSPFETIEIEVRGGDAYRLFEEMGIRWASGGGSRETTRFLLYVRNAREILPEIIRDVVRRGLDIVYVRVKSPSLEDVYLKYIGEEDEKG